jgi:hypothetical protein
MIVTVFHCGGHGWMKDHVRFALDKMAMGEVSSSGPEVCSSLHQFHR